MIIVRNAVQEDAQNVIDFTKKVANESEFLAYEADEFSVTEEQEKQLFAQCQTEPTKLYLIAIVDSKIVGTLHFATGGRRRTRHAGEFSMAVAKDMWGQGIGSLLIDKMIDYTKRQGFIRKISLGVRVDNKRAIDLYQLKGFKEEGLQRSALLELITSISSSWIKKRPGRKYPRISRKPRNKGVHRPPNTAEIKREKSRKRRAKK